MKLYLISQTEQNDYDSYDSAVVCAESAADAATIHPDGNDAWADVYFHSWCKSPDSVKVEYIGDAVSGLPRGIVVSSFNAG